MSDYVTATSLREHTDEIVGILHTFMQQVDDRFREQDRKFDQLLNTIDGFISRIDKYEKATIL